MDKISLGFSNFSSSVSSTMFYTVISLAFSSFLFSK